MGLDIKLGMGLRPGSVPITWELGMGLKVEIKVGMGSENGAWNWDKALPRN